MPLNCNGNRNSPREFADFFTHRMALSEFLQVSKQYETLVMEMWGHGEHHLASMLPATVLRKLPCLCLNCRLRMDGSA